MGAEVATTTSQKNVEWVKKLGADHVIDYNKDNYKNILKNYDVFFNSVDGEPIENGLAILKPGGHLLSIVGPPDAKFAKKAKLNILFQVILGFVGRKINKLAKKVDVKYDFVFVTPSGSQLEIIKKLIESEKIKPTIDKVFSVEQVKEALAYQALGRTKGKVVLKFRDE
jgi:NADPH:quinone reductase-like Zn-dependent oxidoreductase